MPNAQHQIEHVALSTLHTDMGNARRHDQRNLQAIVDSLRQFGQVEPLVVQAASGKVVGGNGRLEAMRQLGWDSCDVVRLDLTDTQAAALGIALNRTGELAQWDAQALEQVLGSLADELDLQTLGFDQDELDRILQPAPDLAALEAEPAAQPDPTPQADAEPTDDAAPAAAAEPEAGAPPAPNVRMVQLFFQPDMAEEFYRLADQAQQTLATPHLSDTVFQVLRRYNAGRGDA